MVVCGRRLVLGARYCWAEEVRLEKIVTQYQAVSPKKYLATWTPNDTAPKATIALQTRCNFCDLVAFQTPTLEILLVLLVFVYLRLFIYGTFLFS